MPRRGLLSGSAAYQRLLAERVRPVDVRTAEGVAAVVEDVRAAGVNSIAVDFETVFRRFTGEREPEWGPQDGAIRLISVHADLPAGPRQFLVDCFRADPSPLKELLTDPYLEKQAFHSSFEQNWAAVHLGVTFENVYDPFCAWQSINKYLGHRLKKGGQPAVDEILPGWQRHPLGLGAVCEAELGLLIPKTLQASNWGAAELSDDQKRYAAVDVAVLGPLTERSREVAARLGPDVEAEIDAKAEKVAARAREKWLAPAPAAA